MGFEDFGEVITDPYRELHPEDSEKWLRMLAVASNADSEFYAVLLYLRETGTILRPHPKFRWKLVPVVGANGWQSYEEYQREAAHLKPWQDKLVDILAVLK